MNLLNLQTVLIMMIVVEKQTGISSDFIRPVTDTVKEANIVLSTEVDESLKTVDTPKTHKLARFTMATVDTPGTHKLVRFTMATVDTPGTHKLARFTMATVDTPGTHKLARFTMATVDTPGTHKLARFTMATVDTPGTHKLARFTMATVDTPGTHKLARFTMATVDTPGTHKLARFTMATVDTPGTHKLARFTMATVDTPGTHKLARFTMATVDTPGTHKLARCTMATVDTPGTHKLARFTMATVDRTDTGVDTPTETERVSMTISGAVGIDNLLKTTTDEPEAGVTKTTASTTLESLKQTVIISSKTDTPGERHSAKAGTAPAEELSSTIDTQGERVSANTSVSDQELVLKTTTLEKVRVSKTSVSEKEFALQIDTSGEGLSLTTNTTGEGLSLTTNTTGGGLSLTTNTTGGGLSLTTNTTGGGLSLTTNTTGEGLSLTTNTAGGGLSPTTNTTGGGLYLTTNTTGEGLSPTTNTTSEGLSPTTNTTGGGLSLTTNTTGEGLSPTTNTAGRGLSHTTNTANTGLSATTTTPGEGVSTWSSCPQTERSVVLTALTGNIVWDEASCPGSCDPCDIVLHVPEDYELTVEFHHVELWFVPGQNYYRNVLSYEEYFWVASDRLSVQCMQKRGSCTKNTELRDIGGRLPVAPLWAQDVNQLRLRLSTTWHNLTHRRYSRASKHDVFVTFVPTSRFNISYQAQQRSNVDWSHLLRMPNPPIPYWSYCREGFSVPEFLLCDGISQCYFKSAKDDVGPNYIQKQVFDEIACHPIPAGCDLSWLFPFRNECFGVWFTPNLFTARGLCLSQSLSIPAFLDPDTRQMVVRKAILTGVRRVVMGVERMRSRDSVQGDLYRYMWWWKPYRTVVHDPSLEQYGHFTHDCAVMRISLSGHISLRSLPCVQLSTNKHLTVCHKYNPDRLFTFRALKLQLSPAIIVPSKFPTKLCPGGFHVQPFQPCQGSSADETRLSELGLPLLDCDNGARVHYTLTCDGHDDCGDGSDETRCDSVKKWIHNTVLKGRYFFCNESLEAVDNEKRCDGVADCRDGSDEVQCTECASSLVNLILQNDFTACVRLTWDKYVWVEIRMPRQSHFDILNTRQQPIMEKLEQWQVEMDGFGGSYVVLLLEGERCPETHVRCPDANCIPSYMLNNGVYDCPFLHTDDEYVADNVSCPGFYRCYRSHICVHNHYLCDGVHHCPFKDDERYCHVNRTCPENCRCEGLALRCREMIDAVQHFSVRYLDLSGSHQPQLGDVHLMGFLQFLNLSGCSLHDLTLGRLEHLKVLDVSDNHLHNLTSLGLTGMVSMRHLDLSDNPGLLKTQGLLKDTLTGSGKLLFLMTLVIQNTGMTSVEGDMFQAISGLRNLDLRRNSIVKYERSSFNKLNRLRLLQSDDMKLCCVYSAMFPGSTASCQAPADQLSSCTDLLMSDFFRICLWLLAVLAVAGNGGVLVFRLFLEKHATASAFRVLVAGLCVSDFTMGVYLTLIGSADVHYSGEYLWKGWEWTHGNACRTAGFLGMLSSEVSAFTICLITLDRLLVLRFPLNRRLHLTWQSALCVCIVAWLIGIALSATPLLPIADHWEFYSQTGICFPLPITRRQFPGQAYSFTVFIGLNFVLFLLIGLGQLTIYLTVHSAPLAGRTGQEERRQRDMVIARRLFLVVLTDFCCWFPVGVMGLMASTSISIPGELNVWTAVFVLPLNSALNPFLYTLNTALERRRKHRELQRHQAFMTLLQSDVATWPPDQVKKLVSSWPADRLEELCRQLSVRSPTCDA